MPVRYLTILALAASLAAQSPEIYSNGPIQTGVNAIGPISVLEAQPPVSLNVFGQSAAGAFRLADQFAVNTLMILDGIEVFGYTTGILTANCTAVQLALFDGSPATGTPNQLLPGAGFGVNLIGAPGYTVVNTLTGIWRVLDTAPTTQNRAVQSVRVNFSPPLTLVPGIYYLGYNFTGPTFTPPVTTLGQQITGDMIQWQGAAWVAVNGGILPNNFPQGLPFKIYGTPTTPPGAITNLGGGCSTATFDVQGSPAVGGYLRATLSNVNPLALGVIVAGLTDPNTPLVPFCTCVSHASLDVLTIGNVFTLQVPPVATLVGLDLFFQGGQLDLVPIGGITACNIGVQFDLTNAFRFHTY